MTIYSAQNIRQLMTPSEHNEQATFFDWLLTFKEEEHPEVHPLFFSVPNGTHLAGNQKQRAMQMNKLKREGLTPGVADTLFLSGRGGYLGLALEFKTPDRKAEKDGGLSENQLEFLRSARMEGFKAEVAYGAEDGIRIVENYFRKPKTQDMVYAAMKCAERGDADGAWKILRDVTLAW
jgi:hypothetical protein